MTYHSSNTNPALEKKRTGYQKKSRTDGEEPVDSPIFRLGKMINKGF